MPNDTADTPSRQSLSTRLSRWNRYSTRVTVTTVGLAVLVALLLGVIVTVGSVRALRATIRQTGTAVTLLLATELEQKSAISARLLSRDRRPPPWLVGPPGGDRPPPPPPPGQGPGPEIGPPPEGEDFPGAPPFLAQDLLEIANLIGAARITIFDRDKVRVDVIVETDAVESADPSVGLELLERLQASPDEHVLLERTGETFSIITTFTPAHLEEDHGLLVQFPIKSAQAIVLPQVLLLAASTLIVLLLAGWSALLLSRSVSKPLSDLVDVATSYGAGHLSERAPEKGLLEIATLGRAFNRMAESIDEQIAQLKEETARREQLEGELRIAAELQQSLLPEADRAVIGPVEIIGFCEAAREVGGDFYDFWPVDGGRLALVIGDATGKGLPAALLAAKCLSVIQALVSPGEAPSEIFFRVNNLLSRQFKNDGLFVTALLILIDLELRTISYSVAGHNPGFALQQGDVTPGLLGSRLGLPLGIHADVAFETQVLEVERNTRLLLYTDGVTETFNMEKVCYGQDRLEKVFLDHGKDASPQLLEAIKLQLLEFGGGCPTDDDRTLVVVSIQASN
jgi:serine phosphatase RsbU (regulator of sigma subunit)